MILMFYIHFRVQTYLRKQTGLSDIDKSVAEDLTEVEKFLLETQEMMMIRGKVCNYSYFLRKKIHFPNIYEDYILVHYTFYDLVK